MGHLGEMRSEIAGKVHSELNKKNTWDVSPEMEDFGINQTIMGRCL